MFYEHSFPSYSENITIFNPICLSIATLPSLYEIYQHFITFITSQSFYLSTIQADPHTLLFISLDTTLAMLRKFGFLFVASSRI